VPGARKRVLSGMRPTGRLHIGNYFGALQNWVKLQNDPQNECFYFIADWHSLTSDYADTSGIAENTIQVAIDFLAGGLDPAKSTIFLQSLVPEHAELNLLLSMVTPLGWLERVPTYKEALANVKDKDLHTYGFLGYPVLQCGDIMMYGEEGVPLYVPVGEDQVSHVELSREIVRKFNFHFGLRISDALFESGAGEIPPIYYVLAQIKGSETAIYSRTFANVMVSEERELHEGEIREFVRKSGLQNFLNEIPKAHKFFVVTGLCEPEAMLTQTPRIPGTDGRKMSKSYGNDISLSESDESIRAKTKVMMTDPARKRRENPGNPDICPVYDWHKLFSPQQTLEWANQGCRTAGIGCIECKSAMADNLIKWITPIRTKRQQYEKHPQDVLRVLDDGSKKAQKVAQQTMARVREAVFGWEKKRAEIAGAKPDAKNVKVGN
jgi:tryptophanyl-tRNA synthetase